MTEKDPDILVDLTTTLNEFEADVIANALREEGIDARAFTTAGRVLRLNVSPVQPMRVAVRRADLERAREVLAELRRSSSEIDWSQVDTGDTSPLTEAELTGRRTTAAGRWPTRWRIRAIAMAALLAAMAVQPPAAAAVVIVWAVLELIFWLTTARPRQPGTETD